MKRVWIEAISSYIISILITLLIDYLSGQILIAAIIVGFITGILVKSTKLSVFVSALSILTPYLGLNLYYLANSYGIKTLNIVSEIAGFPSYILISLPAIILVIISLLITYGIIMVKPE